LFECVAQCFTLHIKPFWGHLVSYMGRAPLTWSLVLCKPFLLHPFHFKFIGGHFSKQHSSGPYYPHCEHPMTMAGKFTYFGPPDSPILAPQIHLFQGKLSTQPTCYI
jgi:hypothetical protein